MKEIEVDCPKEGKKVPIWFCMGSFVQQKQPCPHLIELTVYYGKRAKVKCQLRQKEK